ncbi:plasmid stabilization system protein ParE [Mucilaginibacter yixingensis]|uniref:Plasmid stabilization system protein ParE n=1 Tax=Mucilaginibacter yixingensis TaxID=1295612 RepID=A0A2T5JBY1_9SPHI|nr:type II toxin-antitoxin system RelE/ParE family toxin [Mucilaginibacter yixingensis]PTQ99277.1 plasmid stabilization system protein ParE [Mucilaginibacter yixingensis]
MRVVWTENAHFTFDSILTQIENKWGEEIALEFYLATHQKITLIEANPYLYKESSIPNTRHAVISKQTSMLYEIGLDAVLILFFFDNRQEPFI